MSSIPIATPVLDGYGFIIASLERIEEKVDNAIASHDLRIRALEAVIRISATLEEVGKDHEKRLRFVERLISYGIGAIAVLKIVMDKYGDKLIK